MRVNVEEEEEKESYFHPTTRKIRQKKFLTSSKQASTMNPTTTTTKQLRSKEWPNSTRWLPLLVAACFLFLGGHPAQSSSLSLPASEPSTSIETTSSTSRRLLVKPTIQENNQQHRQQQQHRKNLHYHRRHRSSEDTNHLIQISSSSSSALNESLTQQDYLGRSERKPISTQQQRWQNHLQPPTTFYYDNNNINNNHFKPSESSQVPEQLPIVVSSSDNSYVSASPIIIETFPPAQPPVANHHQQQQQQQQHERTHFRAPSDSRRLITNLHYDAAAAADDDQDGDDLSTSEERKHRPWHKNHQMSWFSSGRQTHRTGSRSNQLDNKISSTSDISTTATTTPRNSRHDSAPVRSHEVSSRTKNLGAGSILYDEEITDNRIYHPAEFKLTIPTTKKPESLISRFEIKLATIINAQESIDAGATFINYTVVTNFDACLVECWITDSCDTAVYQESAITSSPPSSISTSSSTHSEHHNSIRHHNNLHSRRKFSGNSQQQELDFSIDSSNYHTCFLFECVKSDGFRCQFSPHDNYVSSILMKKIATARGEDSAATYNNDDGDGTDDDQAIKFSDIYIGADDDDSTIDEEQDFVSRVDCDSQLQFKCLLHSGQNSARPECIEKGRRCDGSVDCSDGSDESDCYNESTNTISGEKVFVSIARHSDGASVEAADTTYGEDERQETTSSNDIHEYRLIDQDQQQNGDEESLEMKPSFIQPLSEVHYSRIINSQQHGQHHLLNGHHHRLGQWHDTRIASIRIGEYVDYGKGGLNSALIAILFGVAITGMLIMIVGHKMRSIRRRLAYKNRRRSLVRDKELFISTMSI